jgi:hypothetical protein
LTRAATSNLTESVSGRYEQMRFRSRAALFAALFYLAIACSAQQAPSSPQAPEPPSTTAPPPVAPPANGKAKPIPSFLIIGTVFNEKALSFAGVQVRIRRAGQKKFKWQTYTNDRGEFAVRVPPGFDYEVVIHEKNYKEQTKSVDSKVDVQQRLSIKLELISPPNTGATS